MFKCPLHSSLEYANAVFEKNISLNPEPYDKNKIVKCSFENIQSAKIKTNSIKSNSINSKYLD